MQTNLELDKCTTHFKQTRVGLLPVNWEVKQIGKVAQVGNGATPRRDRVDYWQYGQHPWLPTGKVNERVISSADEFITDTALRESSVKLLPKGTILLAMIGQGKTRGKVAYLNIDSCINQNFAYITPSDKIEPWFLFNYLEYQYLKIRGEGRGGNQDAINCKIVKSYLIPVPPLPEQRAIAAILSTWDKGIEKLQHLISAKQKRKKALMQQLLTGKKRFQEFVREDGFNETRIGLVPKDWKLLHAREIFKNISIKNREDEELLAVTQEQGVIPRSMLEGRVMMPDGSTKGYKLIEKGNFVISLRSFQGGLEYSEYRGIVSPAYTILKEIRQIDKQYFKYFFKSPEFISRLSVAVIGIRDGKQISYDDFGAMSFRFPPLDEQTKIASVLQTADKEINTLKQKLNSLKQQKKGLMQKLLTGQVRVNVAQQLAS